MDDIESLAQSLAGEIDPMSNLYHITEAEASEELENDDQGSEEEVTNEGAKEAGDDSDDGVGEEAEESEESETEEEESESNEAPNPDVHKLTVDGEEVEVSLQDLKDNYSGKVAWDKKFAELDTERKAFAERAEQFNNNAKQFHDLTKEGKAQEALDFLCEVAGLDRNQFVEAYVSQLAPTIAEYLEMSPEEREQRALKQQVEYYKNRELKSKEASEHSAQAERLKGEVVQVLEKYSIEADRFEELQKELVGFGVKNLTPEVVGQYHVMIQQQDVALEVLKDINPDLVKDKSAMDYLLSLQQNNPGIKKEDLKARAEKAFVDALSERVKKDAKATKPKKQGSAKNQEKQILTFDDLENINPLDLI